MDGMVGSNGEKAGRGIDAAREGTPHVRRGLIHFLVANVIAFAAMGAIYLFVYYGEFMSPAFEAIHRYCRRHETQAVLAASMPFFASMLVGCVSSSARYA